MDGSALRARAISGLVSSLVSAPSQRRIGTKTGCIGASRLPAGARSTAQHITSAATIRGPYVGDPRARGLTTFSFNASRNAAQT